MMDRFNFPDTTKDTAMPNKKDEAIKVDFEWETHLAPRDGMGDIALESQFVTKLKRYIGYGLKDEFDVPVTVPSVERVGVDKMRATAVLRKDPDMRARDIERNIEPAVKKGMSRIIKRYLDDEDKYDLLAFTVHHDDSSGDLQYVFLNINNVEYVPEYYGQQRLFATEERIALKALGQQCAELEHPIHTVLASTDR